MYVGQSAQGPNLGTFSQNIYNYDQKFQSIVKAYKTINSV
jgi:hypothetical protein